MLTAISRLALLAFLFQFVGIQPVNDSLLKRDSNNQLQRTCIRVNIYFCNHFKGLVVKNSNISNRKVTLINEFMDLSPV